MSSRVTRSSARLSAGSAAGAPSDPSAAPPSSRPPPANARKRKLPARDPSPEQPQEPTEPTRPARGGRAKRTRVETQEDQPPPPPASTRSRKGKAKSAMSTTEYVDVPWLHVCVLTRAVDHPQNLPRRKLLFLISHRLGSVENRDGKAVIQLRVRISWITLDSKMLTTHQIPGCRLPLHRPGGLRGNQSRQTN